MVEKPSKVYPQNLNLERISHHFHYLVQGYFGGSTKDVMLAHLTEIKARLAAFEGSL